MYRGSCAQVWRVVPLPDEIGATTEFWKYHFVGEENGNLLRKFLVSSFRVDTGTPDVLSMRAVYKTKTRIHIFLLSPKSPNSFNFVCTTPQSLHQLDGMAAPAHTVVEARGMSRTERHTVCGLSQSLRSSESCSLTAPPMGVPSLGSTTSTSLSMCTSCAALGAAPKACAPMRLCCRVPSL